MPILKSGDLFHPETSLTPDQVSTGPNFDLREKYGTAIVALITNGGTGPTSPPEFRVELSRNGTDWREVTRQFAKTDNSAVTPFVYRILPEIQHARVVFKAGSGQGSTVVADEHTVDSLG